MPVVKKNIASLK